MATAVIVGNGDFPRTAYPRYLVSGADHIVCCDGALSTWLRVAPKIFGEQRLPDVIIGDMDSLSAGLRKKYAERVVHVEEQDFNDQTKALLYVLNNFKDVDTIHFIGAAGKREDHTIGNLSLLMEYAKALCGSCEAADYLSKCMYDALAPFRGRELAIDTVTDYSTVIAVSDSCELMVGEGRKISIISADNTLRIKSEGLTWPTDDVVFDNLWKATLNRAVADVVKLTFSHPSAALVVLA